MTCKELMTPNPACCVPRDSVVTAAMIMKSQDVGSVPVVSDRDTMRVVGMITDRDVALRIVAEQREYYGTHVEDVMSQDIVTCRTDDDYDEVLDAMKRRQIRRVPVVDSNGRLAGIIAQADIARESPEPKEVSDVVERISKPGPSFTGEQESRTGAYTKTSLLIAGGLGIGAGLIYILDPRWARGARESVTNAARSARQSVENAAGQVRESVAGAADSLRETIGQMKGEDASQGERR